MIKKTYKIDGMDCDSCAKMIELDLEDEGITAKCSYSKASLEVEIDNDKKSDDKVKEVVTKAGYKIIN